MKGTISVLMVLMFVGMVSVASATNKGGGSTHHNNNNDSSSSSTALADADAAVSLTLPQGDTNVTTTTNLDMVNQPVSLSEGGDSQATAVGLGGGGGSALSVGGDQYMVLTFEGSVNRQHIGHTMVGAPGAAQMFDAWEKGAPNVSDIGRFSFTDMIGNGEVDLKKNIGQFFVKKGDVDVETVYIAGYVVEEPRLLFYYKPIGQWVGYKSIVATEEFSSYDIMFYLVDLAKQYGADQIEIQASSGMKMPTMEGWSLGFGSSGSALMGPEEELAGSLGVGTYTGKSTIFKDTMPYIRARFFRSGDAGDPATVKPVFIPTGQNGKGKVPAEKAIQ